MNVGSWLLWGLVATLALTTLLAGSQEAGITRMNIPFMLGTIFTPNRDRAKILGFAMHLLNGWLFSLLYVAAFTALRFASWWLGAAIGLLHAAFVLTAGVELLPAMHPRMASETRGPTVTRQLEPPGFLARNYGLRTPVTVVFAHLAYGVILGAFYQVR